MNPIGGWTIETYAAHNEALRLAEEKFKTERDRRYSSELEWVRREVDWVRRESTLVAGMAKEATAIAAGEARERLKSHNGLLEQMRENEKKFASLEKVEVIQKFQYYMTGGLILLGAIGIANLVKLWAP